MLGCLKCNYKNCIFNRWHVIGINDKMITLFQLSYADLAFVAGLKYCDVTKIDPKLHNFPKLNALKQKVESQPNIAKQMHSTKDLLF